MSLSHKQDFVISNIIENLGKQAKHASEILAQKSSSDIDKTLKALAENLIKFQEEILQANDKDIKNAQKKGLSSALIDRLRLDEIRIKALSDSVLNVMNLKDPTGKILWE